MKKALLVILTLALLAQCALIGASAAETFIPAHPMGYQNDAVDMVGCVSSETMEALCKNSDGSYSYSNLGTDLGLPLTSSTKEGTLGAVGIADVADLSHGISLIGATNLDRPIQAVSDGVWSQGGTELDGVKVGAGGWLMDEYFYNANGETQQDKKPNAEDGYIYTSLLTYNFGSVKRVDYMILAQGAGSTTVTGAPAAGDIYVSNDGITWTLYSYYDIPEIRINGSFGDNRAYEVFPEKYLGNDRYGGGATSSNKAIAFDLEGLEAQYVRIAFTGGRSKGGSGTYESCFNNVLDRSTSKNTYNNGSRDILIIGGDVEASAETEIDLAFSQTKTVENDRFGIRLTAEINTTSYATAGFDVSLRYFDAANTTSTATKTGVKTYFSTTSAYTSLLSFNGNAEETVTADDGKYFVSVNLLEIPTSTHVLILEVTPHAVTAEGADIYGSTYCIVYVDGVYQTTYSL